MHTFVTEIPKGDTRRRHMSYDKSGMVDLGSLADFVPFNDGVCPMHYGYLKDTHCKADSDEVDAILISNKQYAVSDEASVRPIGMFVREDGDQKVLVVEQDSPLKVLTDISDGDMNIYEKFFCYKSPCIEIVSDLRMIDSFIASQADN